MPQDPNLYGQPAPKRRKNNAALTSTLDFTAQLTSLLNGSATSTTSAASRSRPGPSKITNDAAVSKSRASREARRDNKLSLKDAPGQDEAQTLASTRRKMEEKARLYAAMKRGDYVSKENEAAPLVDFDRKWAEAEEQREQDDESSSGSDNDYDGGGDKGKSSENNTDGNELVEYEDEFGRLRRGTKAEIDRLERQRRRGVLGAEALEGMAARPKAPTQIIYGDTIQTLAFVPEDAENMDALARKRDRSPTPPEAKHYDADSEIRTKGAGFYKFSRDEETRMAEMENLEKERQQTEEKRRALDDKKQARRQQIEERRKELEGRRAKKMADNFLDTLAADYGGRESDSKDETEA
ncbi:hypothetical protein D7B24_002867 [Verticillium nonalfalfae]|uniref:Coiled-coil domain-containing protein 174 n=1 Tax=Verticillium nonalfalfae TaxID=1051616 RepID=A0A3M9XXP4_9PEZI|nr:uncharacterized protein D7B24_002867 [Verticillium nonalfalfae]RNJ52791.1 hypothetical protein D7B24_002867 [Verticillium nonalfalfae]